MQKLIIGAVLAVGLVGAAEARPMSSRMYCTDVQRLVARSGSVVLGFTTHTYDRVVSDQRFCLATEGLVQINVPTLDTPTCFAGYTCREGDTFRRR